LKFHFVVKRHERLPDDTAIPDWQTFIQDKSVIRETFEPAVDQVMRQYGVQFWVTKEYKSRGPIWSADEMREGLDRTYRLILQRDYDIPADLVAQIRLIPSIEEARGLEIGTTEIPKPQLATQASVATQRAADLIYLPYAHTFTKGTPDIKIAVLDTGVDLSHKELRGKLARGADFVDLEGLDTSEFVGDITGRDAEPRDEVGHGTHVAGIIGANGVGMDEGVAPGCTILPVRVLATMRTGNRLTGAGILDNINPAIKYAVDQRVDLINMSLGIRHTGGGLPHEDVIRYALSRNVTVVAASGNDGTAERYYPGALPGVIAVGAVDESGRVAPFSSYGANITVVAPGQRIYSAFANNSYAFASGTSQAAPYVCGSIALLKSWALKRGVRLTNSEITHILRNTSDKIDSRLRNQQAGYGLINLADAFKLLSHMLN
jgi:subtilisin family serine protease